MSSQKLSRRHFLLTSSALCALWLAKPVMTLAQAQSEQQKSKAELMGKEWSPTLFPWMLATAFFQEDLADGPVAAHTARGIAPYVAKQDNWRFQPIKLPNNQGVHFDAFGGKHLVFPHVRESIRLYRWCLAILRVKDEGKTDNVSQFLNVNFGKDASSRTPAIQYWPKSFGKPQVDMVWHGAHETKGTVRAALSGSNFVSDGSSWNCCLTHRRNGRLFASVNGVDSGYENDTLSWTWPVNHGKGPDSMIGGRSGLENEWAYDCIILGQTELSEATVAKLEGWAMWRAGRQAELPRDHPYRDAHPLVDEEDFPYVYSFDPIKWHEWGATLANKSAAQSMGQRKQPIDEYERIFFDDFRQNSLADSDVIPQRLAHWFAPGWNTSVGGAARLLPTRNKLKVFSHDPSPLDKTIQSGGTLTLSLKSEKNRWFGPAFYSVDDAGKGYSWENEAIFRLRCKAPRYDKVPGGLFPAFWAYSLQPLFMRHLERIEIDFWEFEGKNPYWLNGGASHVHSAHFNGVMSKLDKDAKAYKILGITMTPEKSSINEPLTFWDGQWHTWEFKIDRNETCLNVSIERDGREDWIELYRCGTPKEFLERKYLLVDNALIAKNGLPDPALSHDIEIDFVEVLQKSDALNTPPPLYKQIPELRGEPVAGSTISCAIDLNQPINDVWYHWHVDGYPRQIGLSNQFQPNLEDKGGHVRCMVKAVGAINQPEAWSNTLGPIA